AGAAAKIPGYAVAYRRLVEAIARLEHPGHRHDKSRRAVTALCAVTDDHRLLHSVHSQAFDGDDARPVHLTERQNAGIHRTKFFASRAANQNGAGTTIAFLANDLRPCGTDLVAQPVCQRGERELAADFVRPAVDVEADEIAHKSITTEGTKGTESSFSPSPLW